jgi:hypothetical protein
MTHRFEFGAVLRRRVRGYGGINVDGARAIVVGYVGEYPVAILVFLENRPIQTRLLPELWEPCPPSEIKPRSEDA